MKKTILTIISSLIISTSAFPASICTSKYKGDSVMPNRYSETVSGLYSRYNRKDGPYSALARKASAQCKGKGAHAVTWVSSVSEIKKSVNCSEAANSKFNCSVSAQFYCNCGSGK